MDPQLMAAMRRKARLTAESVSWDHVIDRFASALTRMAVPRVEARV
jgi:hypothetical protein